MAKIRHYRRKCPGINREWRELSVEKHRFP